MSSRPDSSLASASSSKRTGAGEDNYLSSAFSFRTYSYKETLFAEFERLVEEGRTFDGLVIDLMQTGYTLPMEVFVQFSAYAKRLLKRQGVLLFIKADGALTLTRDDPGGGLVFNAYDTPFSIFARYPLLAEYVCATVSGIDRRRLRGAGSTLANHILYTSVPVLTKQGASVKNSFELPAPQNWVLQMVDDYTSVESISRQIEENYNVQPDETLRILQELESDQLIFPIFSRIQFLANCYHNRKPFRLGHYMVASGLMTESQLQELLEIQQEEGWGKNQKTFLGLLAVRHEYITTRELEVLLHDQYLYGGYHKLGQADQKIGAKPANLETVRDSMIGSLGAIEPDSLLQSFSTGTKTGLLTVETRDKVINVAFVDGRPIQARLNKLKGAAALVEFLVTWTEGIFVFRDKGTAEELDDSCAISCPLEKVLLDAAYARDQCAQIVAQLPAGRNSILERVWNFEERWALLKSEKLKYLDETAVSTEDRIQIYNLSKSLDGLTIVDEIVKSFDCWPCYMVLKAIKFLVDRELVNAQQTSLFRPLTVFQRIVREIEPRVGKEENKALLEASLHYVHGNSAASQRFHIDHEGRVSVNLAQVKKSNTQLSGVLLELRRWMEAYLAYCRREIDPELVNQTAARVVHGSTA